MRKSDDTKWTRSIWYNKPVKAGQQITYNGRTYKVVYDCQHPYPIDKANPMFPNSRYYVVILKV